MKVLIIAASSIFVALILFIGGITYVDSHYETKCKTFEGTVEAVYYDGGYGAHYFILEVDGQTVTSYDVYKVGDTYSSSYDCHLEYK